MSEQCKDSLLGKIPKGWRATTLGDVAEYINGFAFKPHHWREAGLPIIRIAQMLDPREAVDRCPVAIPERHVVQDGELLFSWSATLAVVVWDRGPALVNQHIFRVVPRDGIHRNFLFHLLSSNVERLAAQSHGTTMKHVTRGDLLPFEVVMPPESEQRRIAERLDHHQSQLRQEAIALEKLRATKQALADDLLTGRVRVNTREAVPA
jgi:type I restriction enzyme S subunit